MSVTEITAQPTSPVPVTIIGGYLGSGKSTLVNYLLRACSASRIAVLVNDFGQLPIDADLIQSKKGNVISLSGGCVCCSYGNDLSMALVELMGMQPRPEAIIIETSGVALPGSIAASLSLYQSMYLNTTAVIVNVETVKQQFNDRYIGDTVQMQIKCADIVLVNKTDLVDRDESDNIAKWLQSHFPAAHYHLCTQAEVPVSLIMELNSMPELQSFDMNTHTQADCEKHETDAIDHDPSIYESFVLEFSTRVDINQLATLLIDVPCLLRAKGYIKTKPAGYQLIQIVGSRAHISIAENPDTSLIGKIVCIALTHGNTRNYLHKKLGDFLS